MHCAYLKNLPAIEIVASGLHDSIGLYKRPQPEQMAICGGGWIYLALQI